MDWLLNVSFSLLVLSELSVNQGLPLNGLLEASYLPFSDSGCRVAIQLGWRSLMARDDIYATAPFDSRRSTVIGFCDSDLT